MVFDVKKIFRISSDKHGRKEQPTDTDSPSEDDMYSQRARAANGDASGSTSRNASSHRPWAPGRTKDQPSQQAQSSSSSSTRGVRKKASRIGRSKEPGGYAGKRGGREGNKATKQRSLECKCSRCEVTAACRPDSFFSLFFHFFFPLCTPSQHQHATHPIPVTLFF